MCNSSPGLYDITLQAIWHKEDDRNAGCDSFAMCIPSVTSLMRNILFIHLGHASRWPPQECLCACLFVFRWWGPQPIHAVDSSRIGYGPGICDMNELHFLLPSHKKVRHSFAGEMKHGGQQGQCDIQCIGWLTAKLLLFSHPRVLLLSGLALLQSYNYGSR